MHRWFADAIAGTARRLHRDASPAPGPIGLQSAAYGVRTASPRSRGASGNLGPAAGSQKELLAASLALG